MRVVKIVVPPDKSISHRAIMLASISERDTCIKNLLLSKDSLRTMDAFRRMGVSLRLQTGGIKGRTLEKGGNVVVHGVGLRGLKKPARALYLGNSGTTIRLLSGILAGQDFPVVLKGDNSLSKRPMLRIVEPLRKMGAEVSGLTLEARGSRKRDIYPPLRIHGGDLKAIKYKSKIASAQVKSCILLAGLFAEGLTIVTEPVKSRDHTERMLEVFGCRLKRQGRRISLKGPMKLKSPGSFEVPGDISSAAFFIVAGCISPDRKIIIKNVGLNPTRTKILDILKRMGASITVKNRPSTLLGAGKVKNKEPRGDIIVGTSRLKSIEISGEETVKAIDEIPIIMVAACFSEGTTTIRGVGELRVKETDRIESMVTNLRKMGAEIEVLTNAGRQGPALKIKGGRPLHGARVSSYGDHRTAMSMLVAGLAVRGKVYVAGCGCIDKSFPGFENLLRKLN